MPIVLKVYRQRQQGQAIPIGIAAILGITLLMLILFNTGQVVSEKMRLVNTADAAAYSGLVWQARTLNFEAYTNRAMVANQVAIAQLVTLVSWSRYINQLSQNLSVAVSWIPYVNAVARVLAQVAQGFQRLMEPLARGLIIGIDGILTILTNAQTVAYNFSYGATPLTVREVVRANDPNYQVTFLGNGYEVVNGRQWNDLSEQYQSNRRHERNANVVRASRDGFTTDRRGRAFGGDGWLTLPSLPPVSWLINWHFHRQADTRLVSRGNVNSRREPSDLEWEWKAKDTLSLWVSVRSWSLRRGWRTTWTEIVPIAGGSALTSTTANDFNWANRWFTGERSNRRSEAYADANVVNLHQNRAAYHGIRNYWDIRNADRGQRQSASTQLGIEIRRNPAAPVRTSSNIPGLGSANAYTAGSTRNGFGPGTFRADDQFARSTGGAPEISAVSRAQLFFQRPRGFNDRPDGRIEYSNLFNPYWDVHLVNPNTERRTGWTTRGTAPIPALM